MNIKFTTICSFLIAYSISYVSKIMHASLIVEQISGAIFQGGGLRSTTFVSIYQNVRIGL